MTERKIESEKCFPFMLIFEKDAEAILKHERHWTPAIFYEQNGGWEHLAYLVVFYKDKYKKIERKRVILRLSYPYTKEGAARVAAEARGWLKGVASG